MNGKETDEGGKAAITKREVALPKGGGSIAGMGDSFQPNFFSGTSTYSIPITTPAARELTPALALTYSSGSGSGEFGLGFSLGLSRFSIDTSRRIPRYDGKDIYLLDGSGELVKMMLVDIESSGFANDQTYTVTPYIPRLQTLFSKIEHWYNNTTKLSHWKTISKDNITSYYGRTIDARIANPFDDSQIFEWLIDETVDAKGNRVLYHYKAENDESVPKTLCEINRSITANRYIQKIEYGNYNVASKKDPLFAFELLFDYGEYDVAQPARAHSPVMPWPCRPDPFSAYNSGFEIRTFRLCRNVLLFQHFTEEQQEPLLANVLSLTYQNLQPPPGGKWSAPSLLIAAETTGYKKMPDSSFTNQSLPKIELKYSEFNPPASPVFRKLKMDVTNIPGFLNNSQFLPVDLYGEGLPGFLCSNNETTFFLEPKGHGEYSWPEYQEVFPINRNLQDGSAALSDIDGNGEVELVVSDPANPGFYQLNSKGAWENFKAFENNPTDITNPNLEYADVDANGKLDLLLPDKDDLLIYYSEGKEGYQPGKRVPNDNGFPLVKQGFREELVTFADIFGDGLSHRVKVSNGSVECWPCLGYGHFGKKVSLGNAPTFGDYFDQTRLFFVDIDGSGTSDIAYAYPDRVDVFLNQNGNSFSNAISVHLPALYTQLDQINFSDILGNGTSSIVFSKMAAETIHYYYNFAGEIKTSSEGDIPALKPFLLTEINNNCGSITEISYCSSTKFLLADKKAGRPWLTKLRFPVQVVEQTKLFDKISGSVFVNKFNYHDGYYDPVEKVFCGFGFVESWDSQTYEEYLADPENPDFPVKRINQELYVPPVYTRMWYNTGSFQNNPVFSNEYKKYYFNADKNAYNLPPSLFQSTIWDAGAETLRQGCFALKEQVLRTEVYADDGQLPLKPYTVTESNFEVKMLQPIDEDQYAVFMVIPHENISYNYERNENDPVVKQDFVLETDLLCGLAKQTCSVYLSRRSNALIPLPFYPEQYQPKATIATNIYINTDDASSGYWRGVASEGMEFEIFNLDIKAKNYFTYDEVKNQAAQALNNVVPYEQDLTPGKLEARQLSWMRNFYWNSSPTKCSDFLQLGKITSLGLLHHAEKACFTKEWITKSFGTKLAAKVIEQHGGYVYSEGYWWNKGLVQYYLDATGFHLPWKTENCFAGASSPLYSKSEVQYDWPYYIFPVKKIDYLANNVTLVETFVVDYQALDYKQSVDINNNVCQFLFDPLGLVIASTMFGKEKNIDIGGMRIYDYDGKKAEYQFRSKTKDGKKITFEDVNANREYYLQGAASYFFYNLHAWSESQLMGQRQPICSTSLVPQNYYRSPQQSNDFSCQVSIQYSDGLGRILETKQWAGLMPVITEKSTAKHSRTLPKSKMYVDMLEYWLTSGRTVFNNKGKPCEEYLPFFDTTPYYESQAFLEDDKNVPPPTVTHYDPLLRVIRIDTPKGFYSNVVFTPWQVESFDEDDTVLDSDYYKKFIKDYPKSPPARTQAQKDEMDALDKAAKFYKTPTIIVMDNMGNTIRSIQTLENKTLVSKQVNDIQGRTLELIDARLLKSNETKGKNYYNLRYRYMMGDTTPFYTDSIDAGTQLHFSNMFGSQLWSYSARDYCQFIEYDNLQRKIALYVKKLDSNVPLIPPTDFNLVEKFTYGETLSNPEKYVGCNLRGRLYEVSDLAGITTNSQYSMQGQALVSQKQIVPDYKTAMDWKKSPGKLSTDSYIFEFAYDALNLLVSEIKPGKTIIYYSYNPLGLSNKIWVSFKDKNTQNIINSIEYYPNLQKKSITYGNGIATQYSYEETTQRLIRLFSKRPEQASGATTVQDINYTYDPVGNITRVWDYSFKTVFNINQQVDAQSDYTYDAIYQITKANGRQHPGINGHTYRNNKADNSFKQSRFNLLTPTNDGEKLEKYSESYWYDDSHNLIKKQHTAKSASFTTLTPVLENSDRLKQIQITPDAATPVDYDNSGNQRNLFINDSVPLQFNCCENLVKAAIITRPAAPDEANDTEYYVYDSTDTRVLKLTERYAQGGTMMEITEKIYLGNFEIKRNKRIGPSKKLDTTLERYTVRVMIGSTCAAIIHEWISDDLKREVDQPGKKSVRFQMGNDLGSVSIEMGDDAKLLSYEEYFPYGGTAIIAGTNQLEVALKDYRYSGKECDDSTGLYYYGARYYVSWLGRWLNPDPAGTVDGLNLYAFVGNNPLKMIDPSGEMKRAREDTDALVHSVRYLTSDELETALGLANRVFDEAYKNKKLFTDESERFSDDLEEDLVAFFNDFAGSFPAANPTLYAALSDAGGYDDQQNSDQRNRYKTLRTNTNDTAAEEFMDIDFDASAVATVNKFELHHLMYKAMDPKNAATVLNFAMATRGSSESGYIGTHEGVFHLITSGNDSTIYKKAVAGVSGLLKRMIAEKYGETRKFYAFRLGAPYTASGGKPTKEARSPSMRLLAKSSKKREAAGGGVEFFVVKGGYKPSAMEDSYHFGVPK